MAVKLKYLRLAFGLLFSLQAVAVQFIPLSIEELAQSSQLVVQGTVLSKTCLRDEAGRIITRIQLQTTDVWKGSLATNQFTVVQGGGILGNEKAVVSGQADYRPGEEVVAFLVLNQRGEGVTLGLAQGKFEVWKDSATGQKFAHNLFHGSPAATPADKKSTARLAVSELKRHVQSVPK